MLGKLSLSDPLVQCIAGANRYFQFREPPQILLERLIGLSRFSRQLFELRLHH